MGEISSTSARTRWRSSRQGFAWKLRFEGGRGRRASGCASKGRAEGWKHPAAHAGVQRLIESVALESVCLYLIENVALVEALALI
eukprot:233329-Chlamydomonas_euryale.AAC.1